LIVRELFAKLGLSVDAASFAVADQMLGAVKTGLTWAEIDKTIDGKSRIIRVR
jgi:hypothetical protein